MSPDAREGKELGKNQRLSRRILPFAAIATLATGMLVWWWPSWLTWFVFVVTAFGLIGDIINVMYCKARMTKLGQE